MKRVLLLTMLLVYGILYPKSYHVNYITTEDQVTINSAIIEIESDSTGINILIIKDDRILFNISGTSTHNIINVNKDDIVEQGYFYEYLGKLRGSLFIKTRVNDFALIIREV
tara:strand:- start:297 stop:632 length:336 start_codon:yes stop_codon:yes gene_type:complete